MIRTGIRLFALTLLLSLSACAMFGGQKVESEPEGGPVLGRILSTGILRVGMTGTQPPFNVKTRSGQIIGMEADLANALAETMGVRAEFIEIPFGDLLASLEAGEVDLVISQMTMTPERNTRVAFAGPYFISGKAILTKSDVLARADEASDIDQTGIRLAALAGSTSERFIQDAVPSARLIATTDYDQAVQLVINNDVDGLVADLPICVISVLRYPDQGLVIIHLRERPGESRRGPRA